MPRHEPQTHQSTTPNPNPKFRIPSQKSPAPQIEITNQNPTHSPKSKSETEPESGWKTQSKPNQHQDINQPKTTNPCTFEKFQSVNSLHCSPQIL